MPEFIILCDFDGTITLQDTCVRTLEQFANGNWQYYDDLLDQGKISLHECMQKQFGMIQADFATIVSSVFSIPLRQGFTEFITFCHTKTIAIEIVSAGLDFIINAVLSHHNLDLPVISARAHFDDQIRLTFPSLHYPDSADFKADRVRYHQAQGKQVIFIGDGSSDFQGARQSNFVFAVNNSKLNVFFENGFSDFWELQNLIAELLQQKKYRTSH